MLTINLIGNRLPRCALVALALIRRAALAYDGPIEVVRAWFDVVERPRWRSCEAAQDAQTKTMSNGQDAEGPLADEEGEDPDTTEEEHHLAMLTYASRPRRDTAPKEIERLARAGPRPEDVFPFYPSGFLCWW